MSTCSAHKNVCSSYSIKCISILSANTQSRSKKRTRPETALLAIDEKETARKTIAYSNQCFNVDLKWTYKHIIKRRATSWYTKTFVSFLWCIHDDRIGVESCVTRARNHEWHRHWHLGIKQKIYVYTQTHYYEKWHGEWWRWREQLRISSVLQLLLRT